VVLNLFWIPAFGVMGAVWATLASFVALNAALYLLCPRDLRAMPDGRATAIAASLALLVWLVAHFSGMFGASTHLARLIVMVLLLTILYAAPALVLDAALRQSLQEWWYRRRGALP